MKNLKSYATIVAQMGQSKQSKPVSEGKIKGRSPQQICPHCSSRDLKIGAGLKPNEESRRCNNCQVFLGYSPVSRLKKAQRRKQLTNCIEILENQGIYGETALFTLSLANDNGGEI